MAKIRRDELQKKIHNFGYGSLTDEELFKLPGGGGKKFKPEGGRALGITSLGKLIARNANRSVIKRKRQIANEEIRREIERGANDEADRTGNVT